MYQTMPNSTKTVLDILGNGAEFSQKEIIKMSGLTERTVRYVLNKLEEMKLISIKKSKKDRRIITKEKKIFF